MASTHGKKGRALEPVKRDSETGAMIKWKALALLICPLLLSCQPQPTDRAHSPQGRAPSVVNVLMEKSSENDIEAPALPVHIHGQGQLTLIQEQQNVVLNLVIPTESLWGFEHVPKTDDETQLVRTTIRQLTAGHRFFTLSHDAQCRPAKVAIIPPPELKSAHWSDHMTLQANWHWKCQSPRKLATLSTELFDHYPSINELQFQYLTELDSGGERLTKTSPSSRW